MHTTISYYLKTYNKAEQKEQWKPNWQKSRRRQNIEMYSSGTKDALNICWLNSVLVVFWLAHRYICAELDQEN